MVSKRIIALAAEVLAKAESKNKFMATAESCTGGLVSAAITAVPGSSAGFDRGFVTYTNKSKHELLGVPLVMLETDGAVSKKVALAMAQGAISHSDADIAVSITGIAGPNGNTADKPVGLVHFGGATREGRTYHEECRFGDLGREKVREESVEKALSILSELL